jgi:Domain of unknown function (DUF1844)
VSGRRGDSFVIHPSAGTGPIDFTAFLLGLASTALIHMGATPHPETGRTERDEVLARESLDLLALLKEKTRGNLSAEEERLFSALLTDLRLKFVGAASP